ncbi:VapE domain-containing protein [Parabacteroides sp. PF5-6]|uniref:BT4734/BF3469 family protein n=1 Tax=Parabacteroides sp. PF5-6 TaxID=1742403 RepID=UPI00240502AF|nr:VapE domain-containing protein [Parabacteroides sp. PF5-6]MDF9830845.1 hypothetical protein [Parabacteroides sp. PF5-6]
MEVVKINCFERFNKNLGDYSLAQVMEGIQQGRWREQLEALRQALEAGDTELAERLKKALPAITVSARYAGARRLENLVEYTGLVVLDIDHLDADQVDPVKWRAQDVPYTRWAFASPSNHGVKIVVDPRGLINHALTVNNHRATFEACRAYYEAVLGVVVDPSGKDPGRLCFVSWDPDMYIAPEEKFLQGEEDLPQIEEDFPPKTPGDENPQVRKIFLHPEEDSGEDSAITRKEIGNRLYRSRKQADRVGAYAPGNRNNYLYIFGHYCRNKHIAIEDVLAYCSKHFSDLSETERDQVIQSAYNAPRQEIGTKKGRKPLYAPLQLIEEYLTAHYQLRRNVITQRLETRPVGDDEQQAWTPADEAMINSLWCELVKAGVNCQFATFRILLSSNFVKPYHPFEDYFYNLPPWDGQTDYIRQVADTVETTQPELWHDCFRRWIVAMVASALVAEVVNHTVLVLCGAQGLGKTTWCINLIPPELRSYVHSGPADPRSKDIRLALAECILINLDELGALSERELNQLKEMITTPAIRERRHYGREHEIYARCCTFCASANMLQILTDVTGSRRFLCFETRAIDYRKTVPYEGLFAQALALWREGFRYWFAPEEVDLLHTNNEPFRIQSPEEELFFTYFRRPTAQDRQVLLLTSTQILQLLNRKAPILITRQAVNHLSAVLRRHDFEQVRLRNKRVFRVIKIDEEEIDRQKTETLPPPDAPDPQSYFQFD